MVAQTRIQYNEQQLIQLMHQHLLARGFSETAATLQKEASIESSAVMKPATSHQAFHYRSPATTGVGIDSNIFVFSETHFFFQIVIN